MEESSIIKETKPEKAPKEQRPKSSKNSKSATKSKKVSEKVEKRESIHQMKLEKQRDGKSKERSGSRDHLKRKPDTSSQDRKLQEADMYLRKLHEKQQHHQQKPPEFEGDMSELSSWNGDSINIKPQGHPQSLYAHKGLPDKERLLEDILVLRQTRNINEE